MKNCILSPKCVAGRQKKAYDKRSCSEGSGYVSFYQEIGGKQLIKGKKRMLCGLMAVCCLLGLTACHKAEEPAPTVEPAPTAASGQNPLQNAVIDYLNQRDNSVAKANEIMEAYQPAEGETDYTNLINSLFTPNFKADDGLVDLLQSMVKSEQTETGFHMSGENGGSGDLVLEGNLYTYHFQEQVQDQDTVKTISHVATLRKDGGQLDAKTESTAQGGVPILINWLQVSKEQGSYQVQQFYTNDGGSTHQLIQIRFQEDQLEYAVYENVETKPNSIFEQGTGFLQAGFVTKVTLKDGKVTVNNDGKELVFGG